MIKNERYFSGYGYFRSQQIVGLAVTEDLFDTNQPPMEEIKLSEVIGPDQRIHCCQQLGKQNKLIEEK